MAFRSVGKLTPSYSCGLTMTKSKPIPTVSEPPKRDSDAGKRLFVDISGPFPLTEMH